MAEENRGAVGGKLGSPGPYLAKIVSHLDPTYNGILQVELLRNVGSWDSRETMLHSVKYLRPFAGNTSVDYVGESPDDYNNTQKSYGMWMIPPDVGNIVVVIFIDGDPKHGYWIGCVPDAGMNFQVPGYAATQYHVDGKKARVPVGEYNKLAQNPTSDVTKVKKPASPLETVLTDQGTIEDDIRGITTSSARREIPSAVFGISTPGPVDKKGKTGKVGKHEHKIPNAFVSRLGGSSFVMDDGDDKWERTKLPSDGPPEYVSVEDGQTGLRDIPHNELIRFRTRTGHQILMHNSEDLIYIGNARGTAWVELTSDGKIDVYAEDSISFHTKQDFNVTADRDINLVAGRHMNMNIGSKWMVKTGASMDIKIGASGKLTLAGSYDTKAGGHIFETSDGSNETNAGGNIIETAPAIHMNGPGAASAASAEDALKARRVPKHEPWSEHENLDPMSFKPAKTEAAAAPADITPAFWKKYTTATDTFAKVGK
jgi:hypothetical protein